jgi:hypothetical protein
LLKKFDCFQNVGGLNLTDSQFYVRDGQATGGYNYDYVKTGGIQKILGISKLNTVADTQTNCLGAGLHNKVGDNAKTVVRAAGTKIQTFDPSDGLFENQVDDTALADTDFLASGSTQPVLFAQYTDANAVCDYLWLAGGGLSSPVAYVTFITNGEYTWTASADFVSGNTIAFSINGRAYSVPYATNNITTLTNVAVAMSADEDVESAQVTDGLRRITIVGRHGTTLAITGSTVTGGASQATISVATVVTASGTDTTTARITENGVTAPTGTFTVVNQGAGTGGAWGSSTGNYYYAIALRKKSTQAISNCALDVLVVIATATDSVLLTFPTGIDTTKYDKWYVYRSSVGGSSAFTAGTLVARVATSSATFTDTNISIATSQNVPRTGNGLLDNSPLPSGTYNTVCAWKRRLVTAKNSTVYISDLNKSESWPIGLPVVIPTGGPIRSVNVVGCNPTNSPSVDEFLVVHKDTETWIITGSGNYDAVTGTYDIALQFVDYVGCTNAALVVKAGGFLCWVDARGVWMWNGIYKPVCVSRPIEALFGNDGDLDKTNIGTGWGVYYRKKNCVIWTLSSRIKGQNKIQLKLDLRLTAPQITQTLINSVADGVFNMDTYGTGLYGGLTYLNASNDEQYLAFDNAGYGYTVYSAASDNGSGIAFNYTTKAFDCGEPSIAKQFAKVIVWVDRGAAVNLTLRYWAGYRTLQSQFSQQQKPMDINSLDRQVARAARWDLAYWDASYWDDSDSNYIPLTFNLDASKNNNEGDAIMLDFSQAEASAPVLIHGFSIFWQPIGLRPAPK